MAEASGAPVLLSFHPDALLKVTAPVARTASEVQINLPFRPFSAAPTSHLFRDQKRRAISTVPVAQQKIGLIVILDHLSFGIEV